MMWQGYKFAFLNPNIRLLQVNGGLIEGFGHYLAGDQEKARTVSGEIPERLCIFRYLVTNVGRRGYIPIGVSGSPDFLVRRFTDLMDIHDVFATEYETDGKGKCTGTIKRNLAASEAKRDLARDISRDKGIDLSRSLCFADTPLDLGMLKMVGYRYFIRPTGGSGGKPLIWVGLC